MRTARWLLGGALLAAVVSAPAPDASAAIADVRYNADTGHYYKLYATLSTWSSAKSSAESVGGYLCTVTSDSETSWLLSQSFAVNTPWIGGTDEAVEGTWAWSNGETWTWTNWGSGEPNNVGNEDYLSLRPDGYWNDWTGTGTAYYIVEWDSDPNIPATPTNLRASLVSDQRIDLAWDDASSGEDRFDLEKAVGAGTYALIAQPAANATGYSDTDVAAESAYRYRIRAVNAAGASAWSTELSVGTAPPAPSGLTATALTARSVRVAWTDNSSAETAFEVERGNGSPGQGFSRVHSGAPNATSWVDATVQPEQTYSYRVRAVGAGGSSSYTAEASVTTPLSAPTNVLVEGTTDRLVTLTWDDDSDGESGFEVVRGDGCPAATFATVATTPADATSFADDTVQPERTYTYRIRALRSPGTSDWTLERCITTPPYAPATPAAVALSPGRVRVTWADVSRVETSYEVMRAPAATGPFERIALVAPNVTSYEDTAVGQETRYVYRVATIGNHGRSGWAVAPDVVTDAMLVVRKAAIARAKKAGAASKLTISGEFDVGGRGVDLAAAAAFGVGDDTLAIPALTQKGAAFSHTAGGLRVTLKTAKNSSRVSFTLQTDDAGVSLPDADGALTISYANGPFRAVGTVQLAADGFQPPRRGAFVEPSFNLTGVAASLKTGPKDKVSVKGAFSAGGGAPDAAPDVHVVIGAIDQRFAGGGFRRSGEKWSFSEKSLGSTKITLDYAKGAFTVSISGVDLGSQSAGAVPLRIVVEFGDVHFEDTPDVASTGKGLKY